MRSIAAGRLAVVLFFGLVSGVGCGSDGGTAGAAATGGSGGAGTPAAGASFPCAGPSITSSGEAGEGGGA
ncbi:MAG TPA: hypothetical protein VIK01_02205, partial [Polyangiaceae bacterium]